MANDPAASNRRMVRVATTSPVRTRQINVRYVVAIASVAALGGLLFGYDWVVVGGAKPFYEAYFRLNTQEAVGWANSCALVGCLVGSIFSGALSDRFGRKTVLLACALLFCVSSCFTGWSYAFGTFVAWRIIGGVAIGMASNVSPTYIAEISPEEWRGRLVSLNQIMIEVGILAAQIANWLIAEQVPRFATRDEIRASWNGQYGWRWMFTAVAAPALVLLITAVFVPESPRWLAKSRFHKRAKKVLERIGGAAYSEQALPQIEHSLDVEARVSAGRWEVFSPAVVRILMVGITLAVLQQWSGINIIFNYAEEVYRYAGYGVSEALFNIVGTGVVGLIFTLFSLGLVDRVGRRPLMLLGCASIAVFHVFIGIAYRAGLHGLPVLLSTLAAIGCYSLSLAPVTWVLLAELFPTRIRGLAVSISVSALWAASFALTFTFPLIVRVIGSAGTFWFYAGVCLAGLLFVFWRVPETKGKTLEEIESQLGIA